MKLFKRKGIDPSLVKTYEGQKVISKTRCTTRCIAPGDSIQAEYNGKMLAEHKVDKHMTFDGIVIFNVEEGEYDQNVVDGIGAAFVDTKGRGFTE